MEIFLGTCGWSNPIWNPNGLSWYQEHSRLNAIELNMSFYQLPTADQIEIWTKEAKGLLWSIKVNRSVTHFFRFNDMARKKFTEFRTLFAPLDKNISHYLFQLPPNAHPSMRDEVEDFFYFTGLKERFALEWRNPKWFVKEHIDWAKRLGLTVVSADSPHIPREIINTSGTVFLQLYGRSDWFEHHYSRKELTHIAEMVQKSHCHRMVAFLNNDSSQLKNARALMSIFKGQHTDRDNYSAENNSE